MDIKIKKKSSGLPAKSYVYVLSIDYYLRLAISPIINSGLLDNFINSQIIWKVKYKDRERIVMEFLNFMSCYSEDRLEFILPSKLISRSKLLSALVSIKNAITKCDLLLTKIETLTGKESKFVFNFQQLWKDRYAAMRSIPICVDKIYAIYNLLVENYRFFIVKGLLSRRRGEAYPERFNTDAFYVINDMIDSYDTRRSKVPFNRYLEFFIRASKDKIIKNENWSLETGKIIPIDSLFKETGEEIEHEFIAEETELSLEHFTKVDKIVEHLDGIFQRMLLISHSIITPLKPEEEIKLLIGETPCVVKNVKPMSKLILRVKSVIASLKKRKG